MKHPGETVSDSKGTEAIKQGFFLHPASRFPDFLRHRRSPLTYKGRRKLIQINFLRR